jgi:cytochrome c biogenesis protein CcmG/thiol:disulfide interchange protein DsbE
MMFVSIGLGVLIAVVLIVVVSVLTGGKVKSGTTAPPALVGTTLHTVTEASLSGPAITSPWTSHHPTVVVFFASWCTYCKTELPALSHYLATHSLGKVHLVGVDAEDTVSAGRATLSKYHLDFPAWFDPTSTVTAGTFLIQGLPDTVFVNAQGVVTRMTVGVVSTTAFAAGVASLNASAA